MHQESFELFAQWITFLWQALQPTLLEQLFGAMIFRMGHSTSATYHDREHSLVFQGFYVVCCIFLSILKLKKQSEL